MSDTILDTILGVRHSPLSAKLPPGSCDCHVHVFGPPDRFPFHPSRVYTPGEASVAELRAHQRALGLDRVVIVQPSNYGPDNACTLDAVRQLGPEARAVAVVAPELDTAALRPLHEAGVRGLRINLETAGQHDPAAASALLRRAADQAAPLGWHVQVYTNIALLAALHDTIEALPVPLVVDHFARAMLAGGIDQPGFQALLDLVRAGHAWVKLSAPHRSGDPDQAAPFTAALIAANPAQLVWGSDWPHTGGHQTPLDQIDPFRPIDDGVALKRLRGWAADETVLSTILVDNPARLYGFT